jgi:hypothetical protein
MLLRDYECPKCGHTFEDLTPTKTEIEVAYRVDEKYGVVCCEKCGTEAKQIFNGSCAKVCEQIIPTYPGCKRKKAGYTHTSHADQEATKIQSGWGGMQSPSS